MSREALVLLVCCCDFRDRAERLIPSKSLRNAVIRAFPGLFCILRMCAPRRAAAVVRPRGREKSADRRRRILISRLLIIRASVPRWKSPFPAYFKGFPAVSPLIPPYPAFLKYPVSPQQGKSFIFISHKMPEIFAVADRYTVLRNGEFISSGNIKDTDPHAITSDMVGTKYVDAEVYEPRELGGPLLTLHGLSGDGFENIDLTVRRGEIVALTGLAGCGASELLQTVFGAMPVGSGEILVDGKPVHGRSVKFMKNGVGMLPANRKENSVVPDMSILENFYLAEHEISRNKPFIRKKDEQARYESYKEPLHIKADDSELSITSLSGGNQQKVFIARWLNIGADVLLFDNPTQGVDVGAKAEIYKLMLSFAKEGKAVIFNTLEIPEIQKVADRCVVFYEGRIAKIFQHSEVNEHDVMLYSTNAVDTHVEVAR